MAAGQGRCVLIFHQHAVDVCDHNLLLPTFGETRRMVTVSCERTWGCVSGFNPLDQPADWWESLLDELKAHHIPSFHQHRKRMVVNVGASGGVRGVVYFTPSTVSMDEAIVTLEKHRVKFYDVRSSPSGS